jgi:hypothetical protein
LLSGLKKVRADMGREELRTLLELVNLNGESNNGSRLYPQDSSMFVQKASAGSESNGNPSSVHSADDDNTSVLSTTTTTLPQLRIHYVELLRRIVASAGHAKRSEIKTKLTPKIFQDPDGLDNLEKVVLLPHL